MAFLMVKHKSLKATINLNLAREIKLSIKKTGSISQARRFKENVLISDMDKKNWMWLRTNRNR